MKRRSKKILAVIYVIIGYAVALFTILGAVCMWFSGDFLPGLDWNSLNWWIRKGLYVIAIVIVVPSLGLASYGWSYLTKKRR